MLTNGVLEGVLSVHGNVSREFERSVIRILPNVPRGISRLAARSHLKIVVASTIVDYAPELQNRQPQGYPAGDTWAHAEGIYRSASRVLIVAEGYLDQQNIMVQSDRPVGVLFHELGHGVSAALGNADLTNEFVTAYLHDVAKFIGTPLEKKLT